MSESKQLSDAGQNRFFDEPVATRDPAIAKVIDLEMGRQKTQIELIASENIVSRAVLETQGSVLTNKYAEGYPGRRYYEGCEIIDAVESLAIFGGAFLYFRLKNPIAINTPKRPP